MIKENDYTRELGKLKEAENEVANLNQINAKKEE